MRKLHTFLTLNTNEIYCRTTNSLRRSFKT